MATTDSRLGGREWIQSSTSSIGRSKRRNPSSFGLFLTLVFIIAGRDDINHYRTSTATQSRIVILLTNPEIVTQTFFPLGYTPIDRNHRLASRFSLSISGAPRNYCIGRTHPTVFIEVLPVARLRVAADALEALACTTSFQPSPIQALRFA